MNYFSHYLFDSKPNNYWFNLGLLLPDLYKTYTQKRILLFQLTAKNQNQEELLAGCKMHIERDKQFHGLKAFDNTCDEITRFIRERLPKLERDWFYVHVFVELLIDAIYLEWYPEPGYAMYSDYESIGIKNIEQELNDLGLMGRDFCYQFEHFLKSKFVLKYPEPEQLNYAMTRIYESVCKERVPKEFNVAILKNQSFFYNKVKVFVQKNIKHA